MIAGVVTTQTVFAHPLLIVQCFGVACLLRCLRAIARGEHTTFLSLAVGAL